MKILLYFLLIITGSILLFIGKYGLKICCTHLAKKLRLRKHHLDVTVFLITAFSSQLSVSIIGIIKLGSEFGLAIVIGMNITSVLIVIGLSAIFNPFNIRRAFIKFEIVILILVSTLFTIFSLNGKFQKADSPVFIGIFILFYLLNFLKKRRKEIYTIDNNDKIIHPVVSLILILVSFFIIFTGAYLTIFGVKLILIETSISPAFFGFVVIPFLIIIPQLFVFYPIVKKQKDNAMFIEELLQGNILSILIITSIISLIGNIAIDSKIYLIFNLLMIFVYFLFALFLVPKLTISRFKGFLMLSLYACFVVVNFLKYL